MMMLRRCSSRINSSHKSKSPKTRKRRSWKTAMVFPKLGRFRMVRRRIRKRRRSSVLHPTGLSMPLRRCSSRGMRQRRKSGRCEDGDMNADSDSLESCFVDAHKFFPSPPTTLNCLYEEEDEEDVEDEEDGEGFYKEKEFSTHTIPDVSVIEVSKGKHLDVIDVLSDSGRRPYLVNKFGDRVLIDSLRGKYVVICCVSVPLRANYSCQGAAVCRTIMAARSCGTCRPNFEIVVAAKMLRDWDKEDVFNHFFSGFLDDTLAIPFWDVSSRHRLCDSVRLESDTAVPLVVNPQGLVLQSVWGARWKFNKYGSEFFPFTDEHLGELDKADLTLRVKWDKIYRDHKKDDLRREFGDNFEQICSTGRPSLDSLLGCTTLTKLDDTGVGIFVTELSRKVVGIYLCKDGSSMDTFHQFQQRCLSHGAGDFEMVLVCLAFEEDHSSFLEHIKLALKKRGIDSWWLCPSDDKTCRMLARLTYCFCYADELIIVPPGEKSAELEGRNVLQVREFDDPKYYPFTRESILEKRLAMFKSHTIVSLLAKDFTYLVRGDSRVPLSDLRGKKIILYLDMFGGDDLRSYCLLSDYYSDIQREHGDCEVVFLPLCEGKARKMAWLKLPSPSGYVNGQVLAYMDESEEVGSLIAFGEDGRMVSRNVRDKLEDEDISSVFNDTLRQEILADLADLETNYMVY
ncbi:unnamed protein product [Cuscuta campestris]|uniref:Thioredoxin-like fold domain-containing protein n=1 Tax=Cuscuta campestris TaxID=132261 RepID=A0A484LX92_9ASTE|nr:unnamed protein product [Cuscuta campestris]